MEANEETVQRAIEMRLPSTTVWAIWNPNTQNYYVMGRSPYEAWRKMQGGWPKGKFLTYGKQQRDMWRQYGFRCLRVQITPVKK